MDIQKWFVIESPKEMSEVFAEISAIYYITQIGGDIGAARRAIKRHLQSVEDQSEWFAAAMYLEAVTAQAGFGLRPVR